MAWSAPIKKEKLQRKKPTEKAHQVRQLKFQAGFAWSAFPDKRAQALQVGAVVAIAWRCMMFAFPQSVSAKRMRSRSEYRVGCCKWVFISAVRAFVVAKKCHGRGSSNGRRMAGRWYQ
jgi:hypothetical protein